MRFFSKNRSFKNKISLDISKKSIFTAIFCILLCLIPIVVYVSIPKHTPVNNLLPPSAPKNLRAIGGDRNVTLIWDAPTIDGGSNITGYDIYRSNEHNMEAYLNTTRDVLNYTDTGLQDGLVYYYEISAINAKGEGVKSNECYATPMSAPSAPVNLKIIHGNNELNLSWQAPVDNGGSSITGYNIYRSNSASNETYLTSVGDILNYSDTGVHNGQMYYYKISANNTKGEGPKSSECSGIPSTIPKAPQNLQIFDEKEGILLTWQPPVNDGGANITGYIIYRGNTSSNLSYYVPLGNVLNFTDTNLINGTRYYYYIRAVNENGNGTESKEVSKIYPKNPIDGPSFIIILPMSLLGVIYVISSFKKGRNRKNTNIYR